MSIPTGSTVAVQWEDEGPWTHGTEVDKGDHNHHNRSYKIHVTKTGRMTTHSRKHIRPTPITEEMESQAAVLWQIHKNRQLIHKTVNKKRKEKDTNGISQNKNTNEGERIIRTRYGRIVKKPDRLMY